MIYYQDDYVTLYHGDCREIMPTLGKFDLVLTDPPYGIGMCEGMKGGGFDSRGKTKRNPRKYAEKWDKERPSLVVFNKILLSADRHIIWGGNYFTDLLPQSNKWLTWDKVNYMPTYSDEELAWTSLPGDSVKKFRYPGSGVTAKEKDRIHPTQKPVALFTWCLQQAGDFETVFDPFAGSGTTGVAAKLLRKKCVLIEREKSFCEGAVERLRQEVLAL